MISYEYGELLSTIKLEMRVDGTSYSVYVDGVQIETTLTINDAVFSGVHAVGIMSSESTVLADDFTVETL